MARSSSSQVPEISRIPRKYRLLGLTSVEQRTLEALNVKLALKVAAIVRRVGLPRSSVVAALERLSVRGLAYPGTVQGVKWYRRTPEDKLRRLFAQTAADLGIRELMR